MWLDAFKPKPQVMQKSGVSGVSGVSHGAKPIAIKAGGYSGRLTPEKVAGVSGVRKSESVRPTDTTDTDRHHEKNRCQSVLNGFKLNSHEGFGGALTPLTPLTPQKHDEPENIELFASLKQFRFDLVQADIDSGYSADDLHRVNNMAWEFMQWDGMDFQEAVTQAAGIVSASQVAAAEAAYVDVQALFMRLQARGGI